MDKPSINIENIYIPPLSDIGLVAGAVKIGQEAAKAIASIPTTTPRATLIKTGSAVMVGASATGVSLVIGKVAQTLGDNVSKKINDNLNSSNGSNSSTSHNFIQNYDGGFDFSLLLGKFEGIETYPLNLLKQMILLNMFSISFLFILLNVFIAIYFKDKDLLQILPSFLTKNHENSLLVKILKKVQSRYVFLWYVNRKLFIVFAWLMMLICLLVNQLCFVIIINSAV